MRVSVIWSSANQDGLTACAKDAIINGAKRSGAVIESINLNHQELEHCRACGTGWGACRSTGKCILKDDFETIYQCLKDSEGVIFLSAVYWHDMTECMKAFMDRLRRCETAHNGFLMGKRCILVACAGGTGLGAIECLYNMEETLKHMGMRAYDRIPVVRFNKEYIIPMLQNAGEIYIRRLETGFDMQY
mgnify:CR=1 FL=1